MTARRAIRATVAALLLGLAVPASAADREIRAGDFFYAPGYVRVDPGDTVTWRIEDGAPHDITARRRAPAAFESGTKAPGETFAFTFTEPGRYVYVCTLHPNLGQRGVVQVGPDTVAPAISRPRTRRGRTAVRVSFRLSEDA